MARQQFCDRKQLQSQVERLSQLSEDELSSIFSVSEVGSKRKPEGDNVKGGQKKSRKSRKTRRTIGQRGDKRSRRSKEESKQKAKKDIEKESKKSNQGVKQLEESMASLQIDADVPMTAERLVSRSQSETDDD